MGATKMPNGRWRVVRGHSSRTFDFFDTWEEASRALEEERFFNDFRDFEKGKNRKANTGKTEKPKTEKPKTAKETYGK
jgi:hypothetical protein